MVFLLFIIITIWTQLPSWGRIEGWEERVQWQHSWRRRHTALSIPPVDGGGDGEHGGDGDLDGDGDHDGAWCVLFYPFPHFCLFNQNTAICPLEERKTIYISSSLYFFLFFAQMFHKSWNFDLTRPNLCKLGDVVQQRKYYDGKYVDPTPQQLKSKYNKLILEYPELQKAI